MATGNSYALYFLFERKSMITCCGRIFLTLISFQLHQSNFHDSTIDRRQVPFIDSTFPGIEKFANENGVTTAEMIRSIFEDYIPFERNLWMN